MTEYVDVVVVGGGIGGLAAGAAVARSGLACTVLERASTLGGRGATLERDGYFLNAGGHALYRGGAAARVLRGLGVPYRGAPPPDGGQAVLDDGAHLLPTGAASLLRTGLLAPRAKLELGRLLARLPRLDLAPLEATTLTAWLDGETRAPRVRALVEALVRLTSYANAPSTVSAAAALRQLRLGAESGVLYLDHGWQTLVDGLATAARGAGAQVRVGAPVDAAVPAPHGWTVRLVDGTSIEARTVILAVGPKTASRVVVGPARAMLEIWAEACVPARAACLDLGLRALPRPGTTFALGIDRPLYFSVHSRVARLAPEGPRGRVLIHAMKYLAPEDDPHEAGHALELEAWVDRLQPGWRDLVVIRRSLPDMIATNDVVRPAMDGASRPGPLVPAASRLYVVGDWVGREGMLVDATLASAMEASGLACRDRLPSVSAAE